MLIQPTVISLGTSSLFIQFPAFDFVIRWLVQVSGIRKDVCWPCHRMLTTTHVQSGCRVWTDNQQQSAVSGYLVIQWLNTLSTHKRQYNNTDRPGVMIAFWDTYSEVFGSNIGSDTLDYFSLGVFVAFRSPSKNKPREYLDEAKAASFQIFSNFSISEHISQRYIIFLRQRCKEKYHRNITYSY